MDWPPDRPERSVAYRRAHADVDREFENFLARVDDAIRRLPVDEQCALLQEFDIFDQYDSWLHADETADPWEG